MLRRFRARHTGLLLGLATGQLYGHTGVYACWPPATGVVRAAQMSQALPAHHLKGFPSAETPWLCTPVQPFSVIDLCPFRYVA